MEALAYKVVYNQINTLFDLNLVGEKQEWGSRRTKEVFGGKGNGLGKSRRMGFLLLTFWRF